jgi:hypothetical protein
MLPSPVAKKLLIKPSTHAAVVNPPEGFLNLLEPLPEGADVATSLSPGRDLVQVFLEDLASLERTIPAAVEALKPGGVLWVAYPKGGKKAGTDLNRDILWEAMKKFRLEGVTLVAIDERWSSMRFKPMAGG